MRRIRIALLSLIIVSVLAGQAPQALSPGVKPLVTVDAPVFALTHVRVIDGTGAPACEDQTLVVSAGKIQAIGDAASTSIPAGAKVLELRDYTVIPGIVGMHDHIFYPAGPGHYNTLEFSAPRLYLACGVTTIRTTGGLETYTELNLKRAIERGSVPGPKMSVTSPYFEGRGAFTLQMHELSGPEEARRMVQYWDEAGVDDFKAYTNISRAELAAVIEEVHKRGKKITGHLCSIGFREAAALGIDDLEHGLFVDTEFAPGKKPDVCPPSRESREAFLKLEVSGPEIQETIRQLVGHKVAVTSTLPVFEISAPGRPPLQPRVLEAMAPEARVAYLTQRARVGELKDSPMPAALKKEMEFERAFVQAGGLLLAGPDPTGYGGVLPGFGDQREVELLVEAGFTAVEAIRIATLNGALYLNRADKIGTLRPGKVADMVLIKGNPAKNIVDIEKVETVFKDGVGYDSAKLIESVRGTVGIR
ncbi:MAG: amidohydrolase family protein [Candidatus Aminicenantes bacterium]|nr:amidohydrolase family protein [Candidatus Aminicenantes bacterium]